MFFSLLNLSPSAKKIFLLLTIGEVVFCIYCFIIAFFIHTAVFLLIYVLYCICLKPITSAEFFVYCFKTTNRVKGVGYWDFLKIQNNRLKTHCLFRFMFALIFLFFLSFSKFEESFGNCESQIFLNYKTGRHFFFESK